MYDRFVDFILKRKQVLNFRRELGKDFLLFRLRY